MLMDANSMKIVPILFIAWKLIKRTKFRSPHETDLVWERPTIDAYEDTFLEPPTGFWRKTSLD